MNITLSKTTYLASLAVAALLTSPLTACGGESGSATDPGGSQPSGSNCPHTQLTDAWINNRLACLVAGQSVIDLASSSTGVRADRAFVVYQTTLDANFKNVLANNASRYFRHFICIRNAPAGLTDSGNRMNLATDLAVALGTSNFSASKPPQVSAITLGIAGGNGPGWVDMPCDASVHPVIVDFNTKQVQSVNPAALAALQVFDL